jgi:hypothetical protein
VSEASVRDRFYYWMILAETEMLTSAQQEVVAGELGELLDQSRRQADIVVAADCAQFVDPSGRMTAAYLELLGETLGQRWTQDVWLDLGLAGDVMRLASPLACGASRASEKLMVCLERALDSLLRWLHTPDGGVALPLDAGASMRVRGKALAGLKRFSDVSPVPLWSLLELLELSSRNAGQRLQRVARSDLVDYLRQEYTALSKAHAESNRDLAAMRKYEAARRRRRLLVSSATILIVYVLATVAAAGTVKDTDGLSAVLRVAFVDAYAVHLAIAATVAAVAGTMVAYRQLVESRRKSRHEHMT